MARRVGGMAVVGAVLVWAGACGDSGGSPDSEANTGGATEIASTSTASTDALPTTTGEVPTTTEVDSLDASATGSTGAMPQCGDGVLDPGEACDDGADNGTGQGCSADCQIVACGDGVVGPGEQCDEGADNGDMNACKLDCTSAFCGDGLVGPGEGCDDGNDDGTDACTTACVAAACGDGFIQPGNLEECDDGPGNADDGACTTGCLVHACGDGHLFADGDGGGEQCDDGAGNGPMSACNDLCMLNVCGDGDVGPGEACDDGNASDGDACTAACAEQRVLAVDLGAHFSCARMTGGVVKCWGNGVAGELGQGDSVNRGDGPGEMGAALLPIDLGDGAGAAEIAAGHVHACVRVADMGVKCWGVNNNGQLGLGDKSIRGDEPGEMGANLPYLDLGPDVAEAPAVSGGGVHTCALLADGRVRCWGTNTDGQLGEGNTSHRGDDPGEMGADLPTVDLGPGATALAVVAANRYNCALLQGGAVKCWGHNLYDQLGLGDTNNRGDQPGEMGAMLPAVDLGGPAIAVAVGNSHNCALLADGSVKCWGHNPWGQLGLGDVADRGDGPNEMGAMLPTVDLGEGVAAVSVHVGSDHSCARLEDGRIKCWGNNGYGQLGLGDKNFRGDEPGEMGASLPAVDVGVGVTVVALDVRYDHACAVLGDGSAKCWGRNQYGQLGLGDTSFRGDAPGEMGDALPRLKLFNDAW